MHSFCGKKAEVKCPFRSTNSKVYCSHGVVSLSSPYNNVFFIGFVPPFIVGQPLSTTIRRSVFALY